MHVLNRIGVAAAVTAAAAISVALAIPAHADTAAQSGDAVIVGSDTAQNAVDFALDGSPGQTGGYNSTGNLNRAVSDDANGDANGRGVYDGTCTYTTTTTDSSTTPPTKKSSSKVSGCENTALVVNTTVGTTTTATTVAPNLLPGSIVLRAGTNPVIRPNGSGAGVKALIADSTTSGYQSLPTGSIQIARMSRLPNASGGEEDACQTNTACGGLHVYQFATDNLQVVHQASTFDGPAGLSAAELVSIYTCQTTQWNQLPGNSGGSSATIHPLIPQTGSGTRNFFLTDLNVANGGSSTSQLTPGTCVRSVQEHDPSGIANDPSPADAIEPFSSGKLALLNSGYFTTGATGSNNPAAFNAGYLAAETGTPGDSTSSAPTTSYKSTRGLYLVIRNPDLGSTTAFQPGSTTNYVSELITGSQSAIRSTAGRAAIAQAGFTAAYKDCGINPTSC